MLRIIAGFLDPPGGQVLSTARRSRPATAQVPPQQRRVGYVPQEGALFPHLDVRGNILFGLPRRERTEDRLAEMLDLADLPHAVSAAYPHQLSGGQQQRVALARALAAETTGGAPRRAVLLARRGAADDHRPGGHAGPPRRRHDRGPGHPRPGRGAVPVGPGRGHAGRPDRPGRGPRRPVRRPGGRRGGVVRGRRNGAPCNAQRRRGRVCARRPRGGRAATSGRRRPRGGPARTDPGTGRRGPAPGR